jgi:hypothetical protein
MGHITPDDYKHKNAMRDLILKTKHYTEQNKQDILEYGKSDIKDLHNLYLKIIHEYKRLQTHKQMETLHEEMLWRGETVARAALIAAIGYPVNGEKVRNFTRNVPLITRDMQEDINRQFPDMNIFKWNKKEDRYSLNTIAVKKWVSESEFSSSWLKTKKDAYSLKLEAWEEHYHYRHEFPRDNFPAQFLGYLKTQQSFNGFKPKSLTAKNKDTFFDYYGGDGRAHPYLNAYGSQSARYQPKATGFIHLKAAWMRSLVEPVKGRCIAAIDYGSEEFLISALYCNDKKSPPLSDSPTG